ncbi:MAG: hypothetical protein FWE34_04670 [Defluviitaleaceae bacterium]|nr:hypothetical protein [Defluviitaleaceae bacterium]
MKAKVDDIINKISSIRAFTDESYLHTTHFAIFLLFGVSDEIRNTLEQRAWEIIVDKKAIAFLSADTSQDIVADVRAAVDAVSKSGVDLKNLTELHFCPLIISDKAEPEVFVNVMNELETYRRNRDLSSIWKPFIILNPEEPSANEWLKVIAERITTLANDGASICCRCCVMTRKDEDDWAVSDLRLLDTVLFVALVHANVNTSGGIGGRIAYRKDAPDELFYTAQTVFISNPVVMRTLRCMRTILDALEAAGNEETELNLGFTRAILAPLFAKLPQDNGYVTLAPLYGVIPEPDGNQENFKKRLREFARTHYRSQFEINEDEIFSSFKQGFLHAFIASGKSLEYLQSLIGNASEIEKFSRSTIVCQISEFPQFTRKSGMTPDTQDSLLRFEQGLRNRLTNVGSELFKKFFNSDYFTSLPRLYSEARKQIKDITTVLTDEVDRRDRRGEEISLQLIDDPDERLATEAAKTLASQLVFSKCVADLTLAMEKNDNDGMQEALSAMMDSMYGSVQGLAGGSGAKAYMELLSATCQDHSGNLAKQCIAKIAPQLKFPVRFYNDGSRRRFTFVWGSQENNFYRAWEQQETLVNTENEFLPIKSMERFVLLMVSPSFTRGDIRGIVGAVEPPPDAEPITIDTE